MGNEIRNPVLRFVVYGHVVLAAGAALQVWWIGDEWFVEGSWNRSVAAFFATMAFYGLARLIRAKDDALKEVPLFIWYRSNAKAMGAVVAVCALLAMLCLHDELVEVLTRMLPVIIPAVLYVTPLRAGGRAIGLRSVPGLKSLVVAWVWAAGTVLLASSSLKFSLEPILIGVFLCFYWAIAIVFDCRDAEVDPPSLRTLPQLFGTSAARVLALLLLTPLAMMLFVSLSFSAYPRAAGQTPEADWPLALPLIGLVLPSVLTMRSTAGRHSGHWLLLDCCIAMIPALALLGERL
jgi:hypothetical protein